MIEFLVLTALFLVGYTYFGYPLLLLALRNSSVGSRHGSSQTPPPQGVAIIITVRNEQSVIKKKIEDTLALHFRGTNLVADSVREGQLDLIVASDCSDDETDSIVESFSNAGVRLVRLPERGGKERAQKAAIHETSADIIVFTDAKITLNQDAIDNFLAYFTDPKVGAVSSRDQVLSAEDGSSGEGMYVRYEMWLRQLESDFNSLIGLSGSCFAVRRHIAQELQIDIPSDFSLLLESQRQGMRGVHAPDVIGSYRAVRTEGEEFSRKVRTVLRGITACFSRAEVLSPAHYGVFSWQVWSHKIGRWAVPWLLVVSFIGSVYLASQSFFFAFLALAHLALVSLAIFGLAEDSYQRQPLIKICVFFCVVNAAIAVAWIKYLSGQRSVAWNPSAK